MSKIFFKSQPSKAILLGLQRIHKHENAHIAYQKQLRSEGVVKKEQIDEIHDNISKILSAEFEQVICNMPF